MQAKNMLKKSFKNIIFSLLISFSLYSPNGVANQQQLQGVKDEISRQELQIKQQHQKLYTIEQKLKKEELKISSSTRRLLDITQQIKNHSKVVANLEKEITSLNTKKNQQTKLVLQIVNELYHHGQFNDFKRLISNISANTQDRMQIYASYLNKSSIKEIAKLNQTSKVLVTKQSQLQKAQRMLRVQLSNNQREKENLYHAQKNRKKTLKKLHLQLKRDKNYLKELHLSEKAIVADLKKVSFANVKLKGLSHLKKKLPWPIKGRIIHKYGQKQTTNLKWKGLVIKQKIGTPIKAIAPGKVIFADWLRGYGLMLVIDHGKGDMSLYGYNQTLLKKVGDNVQTGNKIALIGHTGGQTNPALYFQIRRKGKTVNPISWLRP